MEPTDGEAIGKQSETTDHLSSGCTGNWTTACAEKLPEESLPLELHEGQERSSCYWGATSLLGGVHIVEEVEPLTVSYKSSGNYANCT